MPLDSLKRNHARCTPAFKHSSRFHWKGKYTSILLFIWLLVKIHAKLGKPKISLLPYRLGLHLFLWKYFKSCWSFKWTNYGKIGLLCLNLFRAAISVSKVNSTGKFLPLCQLCILGVSSCWKCNHKHWVSYFSLPTSIHINRHRKMNWKAIVEFWTLAIHCIEFSFPCVYCCCSLVLLDAFLNAYPCLGFMLLQPTLPCHFRQTTNKYTIHQSANVGLLYNVMQQKYETSAPSPMLERGKCWQNWWVQMKRPNWKAERRKEIKKPYQLKT